MDQVQYHTPQQHRREMRSPPPPPLGQKRTMMNLMPSIETVPTFLPSSSITSFPDKQNRYYTTRDPMDRLTKTPYTNMILKRRSAFDEYPDISRSSPLFEHVLLISLPPPPLVSISYAQVKESSSSLTPPAMKPTKTLNLTARSA